MILLMSKSKNNRKPKYRIIKQEIVEFSKKQNVGRFVLFIVGLSFVGLSIEPIVSSINSIIRLGFSGDVESYYNLFKIIAGMLSIVLFAVECFISAIKGKVSIKNIIYFIVMVILVVAHTILYLMDGDLNIYHTLLLIFQYLLPIGYIVGFTLLISGKHYWFNKKSDSFWIAVLFLVTCLRLSCKGIEWLRECFVDSS